ncbi:hypothetical protein L1887_05036 [Cichorium endivia]|nr:hypothetical protein L1887_05036 [Cichorium endivia]
MDADTAKVLLKKGKFGIFWYDSQPLGPSIPMVIEALTIMTYQWGFRWCRQFTKKACCSSQKQVNKITGSYHLAAFAYTVKE